MRDEDHSLPSHHPPVGAAWLGGGADSSNRPWETDRLPAAGGVPTLGLLAISAAALLAINDLALAWGDGLYQPSEMLPRWRLWLGHAVGVSLLPLYIPGYHLVERLSRPVFLLGSLAAVVAASGHALGRWKRRGSASAPATSAPRRRWREP